MTCLTYGLLMPKQCLVGRGRCGTSYLLHAAAMGQLRAQSRWSQHISACLLDAYTSTMQMLEKARQSVVDTAQEATPTSAFLTYLREDRVKRNAVTHTSSRSPR